MPNSEGAIDLQEEKKGNVTILKFKGRLDAITSPKIEKRVFESINNGQHQILLNFAEVDYLSSAGMRMLLATTKKLKSLSGKLVLCSVNPSVMDILRMSGFDHVLEITADQEMALRKF
jgi:anti-sigma B factor antagonist/stage II sporulation protein AA (anti-sigma F factor antagonist)